MSTRLDMNMNPVLDLRLRSDDPENLAGEGTGGADKNYTGEPKKGRFDQFPISFRSFKLHLKCKRQINVKNL